MAATGAVGHAWLRNILLTFTISGLWHGASWNFIVWGCLHGLYYVPLIFTKSHRRHIDTVAAGRLFPTVREGLQIATTFGLVLVAWIFFRAASLTRRSAFIVHMCTNDWLVYPGYKKGAVSVAVLVLIEWCQRARPHGFAIAHWPRTVPLGPVLRHIAGIFWYGNTAYSPFIYFQF